MHITHKAAQGTDVTVTLDGEEVKGVMEVDVLRGTLWVRELGANGKPFIRDGEVARKRLEGVVSITLSTRKH